MAVLIDTGSTMNVMDKHTYRKNFARTCKLRKNRSVIHSYHTLENPTPPLKIIGKIDTVVESEEKIIPATFMLLKDIGNKFFYSRYILNIPTEYLITYCHWSIAFSCSEIL